MQKPIKRLCDALLLLPEEVLPLLLLLPEEVLPLLLLFLLGLAEELPALPALPALRRAAQWLASAWMCASRETGLQRRAPPPPPPALPDSWASSRPASTSGSICSLLMMTSWPEMRPE